MKIKVTTNEAPLYKEEIFEAIKGVDGGYLIKIDDEEIFMGDEEEIKDGSLVIVTEGDVVQEAVLIERVKAIREEAKKVPELTNNELAGN